MILVTLALVKRAKFWCYLFTLFQVTLTLLEQCQGRITLLSKSVVKLWHVFTGSLFCSPPRRNLALKISPLPCEIARSRLHCGLFEQLGQGLGGVNGKLFGRFSSLLSGSPICRNCGMSVWCKMHSLAYRRRFGARVVKFRSGTQEDTVVVELQPTSTASSGFFFFSWRVQGLCVGHL